MIPLCAIAGLSSDHLDFTHLLIADTTSLSTMPSSNYNIWLPEWLQVMASCPTSVHVPQEACVVITPLSLVTWKSMLAQHPYQDLVRFFTTGISNGFRIGFRYSDSHLKRARKNMENAYAHKQVVDNYLHEELSMARVAGPFAHSLVRSADSE